MEPIATKFVTWEIPPLSDLKDCKAYQLRQQLNNGKKLSREQKNWITQQVRSNTYLLRSIPLQRYKFDFSDVLKRFFVKQYGHIQEYYAIDKTALRSTLYGRIEDIVEVK